MNRILSVLAFLALVNWAVADLSWSHTHEKALPEQEMVSTRHHKPPDSMRPPVTGDALLQLTDQASWNWLNLAHTDPHHIHNGEPYRTSHSQHFYAPDGAAVLFGWTFDGR